VQWAAVLQPPLFIAHKFACEAAVQMYMQSLRYTQNALVTEQ